MQALSGQIGDANAAQLKQKISLSFSLRDLPNVDTFSKTDAFIVLYSMTKVNGQVNKKKIG